MPQGPNKKEGLGSGGNEARNKKCRERTPPNILQRTYMKNFSKFRAELGRSVHRPPNRKEGPVRGGKKARTGKSCEVTPLNIARRTYMQNFNKFRAVEMLEQKFCISGKYIFSLKNWVFATICTIGGCGWLSMRILPTYTRSQGLYASRASFLVPVSLPNTKCLHY